MKTRTLSLFLSSLALISSVHAQVNVPNTFTSGAPASAAQVNANFSALAAAINSIDSRLKTVEGSQKISLQDLVGTYNLMMFGNSVGGGGIGTKRVLGTATVVEVQNAYQIALNCSAHLQETATPNFDYRPNSDGTGPVSTQPMLHTEDDSCVGHLNAQLPLSFNANTNQITIGGTQVVLMPLGKGMLIGGEGLRTSTANGAETVSTVMMLVRK